MCEGVDEREGKEVVEGLQPYVLWGNEATDSRQSCIGMGEETIWVGWRIIEDGVCLRVVNY